jgi:hypothetical protein
MAYFLSYNRKTGAIEGSYSTDDDYPLEFIPEPRIEITEAQWGDYLLDPFRFVVSDDAKPGAGVRDITKLTSFFISSTGRKYYKQEDPSWPALACAYTDKLVREGGLWSVKRPERELAEIRLAKKAEITQRRSAVLLAGCDFNGHRYQADPVSYCSLTATVVAVQSGTVLPKNFRWRTADDVSVPMTSANLIDFATAMLLFVNECYNRSWELKRLVDEAATAEAIAAITWDSDVTKGQPGSGAEL